MRESQTSSFELVDAVLLLSDLEESWLFSEGRAFSIDSEIFRSSQDIWTRGGERGERGELHWSAILLKILKLTEAKGVIGMAAINESDTWKGLSDSQDTSGLMGLSTFSADSRLHALGSYDHSVRILDITPGDIIPGQEPGSSPSRRVREPKIDFFSVSKNADVFLISRDYDRSIMVEIWDVLTSRKLRSIDVPYKSWFAPPVISNDANYAAIRSSNTVMVYNIVTGEEVHSFRTRVDISSISEQWHTSVSWSADSRVLATSTLSSNVDVGAGAKLWDVTTGQLQSMLLLDEPSTKTAFSADLELFASFMFISFSGVFIWDIATGQKVLKLQSSVPVIHSMKFLENSKQFVTYEPGWASVYSLVTGHLLRRLETIPKPVYGFPTPETEYIFAETSHPEAEYSPNAIDGDSIGEFVPQHYGLNEQKNWITWNGQKLIWLPHEYRPKRPDGYGSSQKRLACQYVQRAVTIFGDLERKVFLRFAEHKTPMI